MPRILTINGTDRTAFLARDFSLNTDHYGKPCTMNFELNSMGEEIQPIINEEVIFSDDGTTLFAGRITEVSPKREGRSIKSYSVECTDYSRDADKGLIADVYTDETVGNIIADLLARYPHLSEFTDNNVDCDIVIDYLYLGHVKFSEVLNSLATRTAYDFYIDFDKDIHFFLPGTEEAPFEVTDTNGTHNEGTLSLSQSTDGIVSSVIVVGAEYDTAGTYTEPTITANGTATEYEIQEKYSDISVVVAGSAKTVGTNGIHSLDDYQCLYDYSGKRIVFSDTTKPTSGQSIVVSGHRKATVQTQVFGDGTAAEYGLPKRITEKSLKTIESAKQYGLAVLRKFSQDLYSGSFQTIQNGLRAGQKIIVRDAVLGFSKFFYVQKTSTRFRTPNDYTTSVSIASVEEQDTAGVLARLIAGQNDTATASEILELLYTVIERIGISESVSVNENLREIAESISLSEATQVLENSTIEYVWGPYQPSGFADTKRPFIWGGSPWQ